MKLKRVIIYCVLALTIALSGCGDSDKKADSDKDSKKSSSESNSNTSEDKKDATATGSYKEDALFQFGLVPAEDEDAGWGYLNQSGEWVIKPQYDKALAFGPSEAAFVRISKNNYRCINTKGEFVSDQVFERVYPFSSCGIARVEVKQDGKTRNGYFFKDGDKFTLHLMDEGTNCGDFSSDGIAVVFIYGDNGDSYGIIDKSFSYTFKPQEGLMLSDFHNGLCVADDTKNKVCGYMKTDGTWAIKKKLYEDYFKGGKLADNGLIAEWSGYIINSNNELIGDIEDIMADFTGAYCDNSGTGYTKGNWMLVEAELPNSTYHSNYINEKGKVVFPYPIKSYHSTDISPQMCNNRLAIELPVEKDSSGKVTAIAETNENKETAYLVIDESKKIIFNATDLGMSSIHSYYSDGYTTCRMNSAFAVIDDKGNVIFKADKKISELGEKIY